MARKTKFWYHFVYEYGPGHQSHLEFYRWYSRELTEEETQDDWNGEALARGITNAFGSVVRVTEAEAKENCSLIHREWIS